MRIMDINYAHFSRAGRRRVNQDAFSVSVMPETGRAVFVVCDGMGGHALGEVASKTVCDEVYKYWHDHAEEPDGEEKFMKACREISMALDKKADSFNHAWAGANPTPEPLEMGTTLVMAAVEGDTLTVAHCGDSRCYLLRKGEVVYQTNDHINKDAGWDVVSRCFFSYRPEAAVPEIVRMKLEMGDRIFLCTDGVYKSMAPEILTSRLMDDKPLEEITDVIEFLCEKNSDDNYTGVLIETI